MLAYRNKLASEQRIERDRKNNALTSAVTAGSHTDCAWCLAEQGLAFGDGSHGICARHEIGLLQQYQEHRAAALTGQHSV
jgi:hypothetical protein